MVRVQKVVREFENGVFRPYNEIKNDMKLLKTRSQDIKLRTNSIISNIYLYVVFVVIGMIGIVTKNSLLLLFSGIVLGVIVLINILYLML